MTTNAALNHIFNTSISASTKGNIKSVRKKFEAFYKEFKASNTTARKDLTFDNMKIDEVTNELIGKFANYLAQTNLKRATVGVYFSTFKTQLNQRFAGQAKPHCMSEAVWSLYLRALNTKKVQQSLALDTPLFGEYESATNDDLRALSAVAYWEGSKKNAEFLLLFLACVTNCGRGSEVRKYYFGTH